MRCLPYLSNDLWNEINFDSIAFLEDCTPQKCHVYRQDEGKQSFVAMQQAKLVLRGDRAGVKQDPCGHPKECV